MNIRFTRAIFLVAFFIAMVAVPSGGVFAQDAPSAVPPVLLEAPDGGELGLEDGGEATAVANVNIYSAEIIAQEDNVITISFDLANGEFNQPNVKYGVTLVQTFSGGGQTAVDRYVFDEVVNLHEQETIHKDVVYTAPAYLDGTYEIVVLSENENGLPLGINSAGDVTLSGTGAYIEIPSESCYLTIKEDAVETSYTLSEGVSLRAGETLVLNCSAVSHFDDAALASVSFETHKRSVFGKLIEKGSLSEPVLFTAGEKQDISISLPVESDPQAYDVSITLTNAQNEQISNTIVSHYVISGKGATIQNVRLDKDYYQEGDTALVSFFWTGAPDGFAESRTGNTALGPVTITASIIGGLGEACSEAQTRTISETQNPAQEDLRIPINGECTNPTAKVSILDEDNNMLAEGSFGVETDTTDTHEPTGNSNNTGWIAVVSLIILVLLVLGVLIFMRKLSNTGGDSDGNNDTMGQTLALFLVLAGSAVSMFGAAPKAEATTFFAGTAIYVVNFDQASYSPRETVTLNATGKSGTCSNGGHYIYLVLESPYKGDIIPVYERHFGSLTNLTEGDIFHGGNSISWTAPSSPGSYSAVVTGYGFGPLFDETLRHKTKNLTYAVDAPSNTAPNKPTINYPSTGVVNTLYTFSFTATDPDGDDVKYKFDWDADGTPNEPVPVGNTLVPSGTTKSTTHKWTTPNTYTFQARTKDEHGALSGWTTKTITISNSAPTPPGECGSADGGSYTNEPSSSKRCDNGSTNWIDRDGTDGTLNWKCHTSGGDDTCSATASSQDAACGIAHTQTYASKPSTSERCSVGNTDWADKDGLDGDWNWDCTVDYGGSSAPGCYTYNSSVGAGGGGGASTFILQNSNTISINDPTGTGGISDGTTITVAESGGFNDNVALSVTEINGVPVEFSSLSDATFNFSDTDIDDTEYPIGSTFSVTIPGATPSNTYTVTIEGTGGGVTDSVDITLDISTGVASFSLQNSNTINFNNVSETGGTSDETTITVLSDGGFTDDVMLSVTEVDGNPVGSSPLSGVTFNFSDTDIDDTEYSTGSTFSVTIPSGLFSAGTYNVTIEGTGGGLTDSVDVSFDVSVTEDSFSLQSSNPISITDTVGIGGTSDDTTITVVPSGSFTDSVALSVISVNGDDPLNVFPGGIAFNFSDDSISNTEYSVGSIFNATIPAGTPSGTYIVTVEGSGGGLTRTASFSFTVNGSNPVFNPF